MNKVKVIVGLSGGVDSAVSAALLQRAGAEVVGAFIRTWVPDWLGNKCDWRKERRDAMRVAAHLNIPFLTIDLRNEYKKGVADYMIAEYKAGRTPNPDVMCNKEVKFGAFLRKALHLGGDAIATGHYARISPRTTSRPSLIIREGRGGIELLRGADSTKDQSYFLWTLNQAQLSKVIFPVGHLKKSEVREFAKKFKLPVAGKRDSQGICFLGDVDMKEFLSHYIDVRPGKVFDLKGRTIGQHMGALLYTIGERVLGQYVVAKDVKRNTLIVSDYPIHTLPYHKGGQGRDIINLKQVNWISGTAPSGKKLTCQLRYHGERVQCTVQKGNTIKLQSGALVAPGQSLVLYDNDVCLGGGVIE